MNGNTLDITSFREKNKQKLMEEIEGAVNDTQRVIIRPYPSIIQMTKRQYKILQHDPSMMHAHQSNEHLYRTKYNVMEVEIVSF